METKKPLFIFDYSSSCLFLTGFRLNASFAYHMRATFPAYLFLVNALAQLVEALRYKPEDRWFESRWCH